MQGGLNPSPLLERRSFKPLELSDVPDVGNAMPLATNKSRSCVTVAVMMPKQTHYRHYRQVLTKFL